MFLKLNKMRNYDFGYRRRYFPYNPQPVFEDERDGVGENDAGRDENHTSTSIRARNLKKQFTLDFKLKKNTLLDFVINRNDD